MCENMEGRPLSLDEGWDQQVNSKAQRTDDQLEMEKQYRRQAEAQSRLEKRARRTMNAVALALAMIVAGGFALNYVEGVPIWLSASVAVGGIAILAFVLGWLAGHWPNRRR